MTMQLPKAFISQGNTLQPMGYKIVVPKSGASVIPSPGNNFVTTQSRPRKRAPSVRSVPTSSATKRRRVAPAAKRKATPAAKKKATPVAKRKAAAPAKRKQASGRGGKKTTARTSAARGKTVRFANGKTVRFASRKKTASRARKKKGRTIFD